MGVSFTQAVMMVWAYPKALSLELSYLRYVRDAFRRGSVKTEILECS